MAKKTKNLCTICPGGIDCDECLESPKNSTPVKLYTPKGAARAMLAGKTLKGVYGMEYFWGSNDNGEINFYRKNGPGKLYSVLDFSGLWEAL
jgi:hypothetical protein